MLRRTMPELERSLVPAAMRLYPQSVASYKVSEHRWDFINGSTLEFGYCDAESDVTKYQSAEYDVIRFDELTHFTESQFTYLISRIRGANPYPKQVKSTTNPGGASAISGSRAATSIRCRPTRCMRSTAKRGFSSRRGSRTIRFCAGRMRVRKAAASALRARQARAARRRVGAG